MDKVKFISIELLRQSTVIQDNVDSDILLPSIYRAHDVNLQTALGTTFYDRLKEGVVNDDLNADEITLINKYIQNMMIEWAFYYAIPDINYKMTNKAISEENSEFSNTSALSTVKYLRNDQRDLAEFYTKRLVTYLCDYENLFPEYNNPDENENLRKNSKSYFNGVYIPRSNVKDPYHKR